MMPDKPSCCLLMNQDGCDEPPVKSSEQQQCCAGCVICLALPAETTPFVYASTGDEAFSIFNIRAHYRAHRPEVPPPRQAPRLIDAGSPLFGARENGTSTKGIQMKYLLLILTALALSDSATATSGSADCCGGGSCCQPPSGCCTK